ncbi:hypothetical protein DFH11DRAFT_1539519 [Phellopilus nigrolimitatus]|nr:hypothetical protein DFH11DRAFT_1539519 [Phellopilus nigrolimitatus]
MAATMSDPSALPPHAVTLLLSYLSPLDQPLPPHLLSAPLRQRHHFLGLGADLDTPQDAAAYLSWPAPSGVQTDALSIADLLGALPSAENFDPLVAYPIKYSYDGEAVYAHAQVPVHDFGDRNSEGTRRDRDERGRLEISRCQANAFPRGHSRLAQAALDPTASSSSHTATVSENAPHTHSVHFASSVLKSNSYQAESGPDSDDDAYWNLYGRSSSDDDEDESFNPRHAASASGGTDDEKAEDAYWAQYASVHGTADSTRPSPLLQKHKLHDPSQPLPAQNASTDSSHHYDAHDERHPGVYDSFGVEHVEHLQQAGFTNFADLRADADLSPGALSARALARRLHSLSPRPSHTPSPAPREDEDTGTEGTSSLDSSDSPQTSDGLLCTPPVLLEASPHTEIVSPIPRVLRKPFELEGGDREDKIEDDVDAGLRDAIKGLYCLWATTRKGRTNASVADEKDAFIRVVNNVVLGA